MHSKLSRDKISKQFHTMIMSNDLTLYSNKKIHIHCLEWRSVQIGGAWQFRNIGHSVELTLATNTDVEPFNMPIQFPPYPKHLMPFCEVLQQPHKTFVGND
jgi:hypothetical protein